MDFVLGLVIGGSLGWYLARQTPPEHATRGYFAGVKAPRPGPPPPPPPGACPNDMMWDPVNQECVPVLPWPIQQG
jgi:hypothetical protein